MTAHLESSSTFDFADLLDGADQIASFLYPSLPARARERRVYHLVQTRQIPAFKLSGRICARRSTLREHFARLEAAAMASAK